MESKDALVIFQGKKIRRTWFNDEWWFSVADIVGALTESDRARKYWSDFKKRLTEEGFELSAKIGQLKLISPTELTEILRVPSRFQYDSCSKVVRVFFPRIEVIHNSDLKRW